MITGKALLVVWFLCSAQNYAQPTQAAFLTQTVTLEDQTTVKFEIWYGCWLRPAHLIADYPPGILLGKKDTRRVISCQCSRAHPNLHPQSLVGCTSPQKTSP